MVHSARVDVTCPQCGKTRSVEKYYTTKPTFTGLCRRCNGLKFGESNPCWRGGRYVRPDGYVVVSVLPTDPLYPMTRMEKGGGGRRVLEHRIVMARHLGRCLEPWEIVHHINRVRNDNRLENLELLPDQGTHWSATLLQEKCDLLVKYVDVLLIQNVALRRFLMATIGCDGKSKLRSGGKGRGLAKGGGKGPIGRPGK